MLSIFFFKPKTAYGMRISDWSSDVCSSDLQAVDDIAGMEDEPAAKEEPKGKDAADGKGAETNGKAKPAKAKAAKVEEDSDPKVKGKKVAADGEEAAEEAPAQPAPGEEDDDEEEANSISLAAMEAALLPQVLDTFDEISNDRKRVVKGKSGAVSVDLGGGRS